MLSLDTDACGQDVSGSGALSDYLQADLAILLGPSFSDPDNAAALEVGGVVIIENNLNHSARLQLESSTQTETLLRRIEDETGKSLWPTVRIDD